MSKILTGVLDLARRYQDGRVSGQITSVSFSENWFRTGGLYELNRAVTQTRHHLNIKFTQQHCSTPSVLVSYLKKGVFV